MPKTVTHHPTKNIGIVSTPRTSKPTIVNHGAVDSQALDLPIDFLVYHHGLSSCSLIKALKMGYLNLSTELILLQGMTRRRIYNQAII
jgi:hypothetical protein